MHRSLFKVILALNSALLFLKLLVFKFRLGISEIFMCPMSALQIKSVLLDALQLIMTLVGMLTYLEPKIVSLNIL
jgi:hypothetical protein